MSSEAVIFKPGTPRPVAQYDADGRKLAEWPSANAAAKALGLPQGNISAVARGHTRSCGGCFWRYPDGAAPDAIPVPPAVKPRPRVVERHYPATHRPAPRAAAGPRTDAEIDEIVREYRRTGDVALRNLLVEEHLDLVAYHAKALWRTLPLEIDPGDLASAGVLGLITAIRAFDPDRKIFLRTYAGGRVRGAMLDWLRERDWVPRLTRSRSAKLQAADETLRAELGRAPTREELKTKLGLPEDEFEKVEHDGTATQTVSLSRKRYEDDAQREVAEVDLLADPSVPAPGDALEREDLWAFLLRGLGRHQRTVITLRYREDLSMREIGNTLGLSESRVSQIHSQVIGMLWARHGEGLHELLRGRAA